jgi:uncharacterized protein YkwD
MSTSSGSGRWSAAAAGGVPGAVLMLTLWATPALAEQLAPEPPSGFDFAALEADLLRETRELRRDPAGWASHLEARRADYEGRVRHEPDGTRLQLEEGLPAVDEAIAALRGARRTPRLASSRALSRAAAVHARDLGDHDLTGHEGSDGSAPHVRIGRFANVTGLTAENISFGPRTGQDVLMALIVDDGVPDRGHREVLLTPELHQVGVACGPHPSYGVVCVMNLAGGATDRPEDEAEPLAPDRGGIEAPGPERLGLESARLGHAGPEHRSEDAWRPVRRPLWRGGGRAHRRPGEWQDATPRGSSRTGCR